MGKKEKTTVYINGDVKRKAAEMGLNLSKVCENALRAVTGDISFTYRALKPGFKPKIEAGKPGRGAPAGLRLPEPTTRVRIPAAAPESSDLAPFPKCSAY